MEALLLSTSIVALAEIGDKTQLLAFILAAKFRNPIPIILGILTATILNHAGAGALGTWITSLISPDTLRWTLGISCLAMAIWTLIPDKFDDTNIKTNSASVFFSTFLAFFFAEMGDKTQIATIVLAAKYHDFVSVVVGTTLGMMIANVPAVLLGEKMANRISIRWVHTLAAIIFTLLGLSILFGSIHHIINVIDASHTPI